MFCLEIEEFLEKLVAFVRDSAIKSCDSQFNMSVNSKKIYGEWDGVSYENRNDLEKNLIPDVVDETIFYLLNAIDNKELSIYFKASANKLVDLGSDGRGELGGWYMASEGSRAQYSGERFFDVFSDTVKQNQDDTGDD